MENILHLNYYDIIHYVTSKETTHQRNKKVVLVHCTPVGLDDKVALKFPPPG